MQMATVSVEQWQLEKNRRIYYQDIVYSVCNSLDRIFGNRIQRGEGVVCGTFETPTTNVQDLMKEVEARCQEWVRIKFENQVPQMPSPKTRQCHWCNEFRPLESFAAERPLVCETCHKHSEI